MNRVRLNAPGAPERIRPDGADFLKLHRGPARRGVSLMARRDRQKIATQLRQGVQRARSALDAFIFKQAARQPGAGIGIASSAAAFSLLIGNNRRDLISISSAAISKYSAASSRLRARMRSIYSRYWRVSSVIGISSTLKFCRRIRYSNRSSGPSKVSKKTSSASGGI